jgi:hypothetical protein
MSPKGREAWQVAHLSDYPVIYCLCLLLNKQFHRGFEYHTVGKTEKRKTIFQSFFKESEKGEE